MSKDKARQLEVSPSIKDQMEGLDDAAKSAMIDRAITDQELLLKARQLVNYGDPVFAIADGAVSERFGRKSCPVITAVVPVPLLGIRLTSTLWGRLVNNTNGSEITYEASMPKDVKPIDDAAKTRLLAHVEWYASQWGSPVPQLDDHGKPLIDPDTKQPIVFGSEYLKATASAEARLMGKKTPTIVGQLARPTLRKRVVLAATADATT